MSEMTTGQYSSIITKDLKTKDIVFRNNDDILVTADMTEGGTP